ncbi:MAG TPA: ATP-binding cassette domain-containing protein [Methylomirabilota bacterium]|nr:ATP-binding cassette domain-containing protein [Methylomirabilota bacterium]
MIKVENLVKNFGPKLAVNGVSFSVERGEVLGFLGPNGAGKSTTMRMITGFIPPTSGKVTVGGHDMVENPIPAKRLIGYLPENAPGYADMTVHGFLKFSAELRGLTGDTLKKAVNRAIEMCFLEAVTHQSIDTLSKGYRHRTCFAQSIIHDPDVLILDEPTDGLDPNQKHEVRTLIRRMGEKKAIIFSTHILEEVEAVCSRAIIIDRGQIVANGTPDELKRRSESAGAVLMRIIGLTGAEARQRFASVTGVRRVNVLKEDANGATVRVLAQPRYTEGDLARQLSETILREKLQVIELHTEEGRLDEVFRSITLPETAVGGAPASKEQVLEKEAARP